MNTDGTGFHTCKECHKTESLWNHTTTDHKEGEQLKDQRNVGASCCNSGDGTDQRVQSLMFMKKRIQVVKSGKDCNCVIDDQHFFFLATSEGFSFCAGIRCNEPSFGFNIWLCFILVWYFHSTKSTKYDAVYEIITCFLWKVEITDWKI